MIILYIYVTIFTIYFVILAAASLKRTGRVRDKYTPRDSDICVAVYASGSAGSLDYLIKQLKNQQYPKEHYTVYVLLDKCDTGLEVSLQSDLEVNVININNSEPIGKSQAYSILAEKLSETARLDAYVFIDSNNYVNSDFLANVNYYLTKYDVFIPMVNYIVENSKMTFWQNVQATYSRYCSKFVYNARTRLNLTNLINTDAFVIKRDVLNKIGSFDFRDKISEVKYTLKLAREQILTAFVEDVNVYRNISAYNYRIPSLSGRTGVFGNNIAHAGSFMALEYICALIAPNWLVCFLCYAVLLVHSYKIPFLISYTTLLISFIFFLLAFCISLMSIKIYSKEYLYLFAYPLYSMRHIIVNIPPVRTVRNFINESRRKHNIERMIVGVVVTDGKRDYKCSLELISDNGLAKVKFINKGKTYTTKNNHLRMTDAIKEIASKLDDYGLSLKVCRCCKYFQPLADGSTNMVRGCCNCNFQGRVPGDMLPTLIWNTCPQFETQNVVNLF